jgi:hypothetical protein
VSYIDRNSDFHLKIVLLEISPPFPGRPVWEATDDLMNFPLLPSAQKFQWNGPWTMCSPGAAWQEDILDTERHLDTELSGHLIRLKFSI